MKHACDCHAHVFGLPGRFPPAADAAYPPPLAPVEAYLAMLDSLGMERGVLVQAAPYREDHGALLDALKQAPGRLRGIGLASADVTDAALDGLAAAGVCGLRFSFFPTGANAGVATIAPNALITLAPRMRERGLHAQLWMPLGNFVAQSPVLLGLGLPLVLDHMARPQSDRGVADPDFQHLLTLIRDHDIWVKLVPHRVSGAYPDYDELIPFHEALVAARPDRMLWGTDWPFVRMGDKTPDAGHLLRLFERWTPDADVRQGILVDNPASLYGFA